MVPLRKKDALVPEFRMEDRLDVQEVLTSIREGLPDRDPRGVELAKLAGVRNIGEVNGMSRAQVIERKMNIPRYEGMRVRVMRKDSQHWERGVCKRASCTMKTFVFMPENTAAEETLDWNSCQVVNEFEFMQGKAEAGIREARDWAERKRSDIVRQAMDFLSRRLQQVDEQFEEKINRCAQDVNRMGGAYRHILKEKTPTTGRRTSDHNANPAKDVVPSKAKRRGKKPVRST